MQDINDHTPIFVERDIMVDVAEGAAIDQVLVSVEASDNDAGINSEVRYSLAGGQGMAHMHLSRQHMIMCHIWYNMCRHLCH